VRAGDEVSGRPRGAAARALARSVIASRPSSMRTSTPLVEQPLDVVDDLANSAGQFRVEPAHRSWRGPDPLPVRAPNVTGGRFDLSQPVPAIAWLAGYSRLARASAGTHPTQTGRLRGGTLLIIGVRSRRSHIRSSMAAGAGCRAARTRGSSARRLPTWRPRHPPSRGARPRTALAHRLPATGCYRSREKPPASILEPRTRGLKDSSFPQTDMLSQGQGEHRAGFCVSDAYEREIFAPRLIPIRVHCGLESGSGQRQQARNLVQTASGARATSLTARRPCAVRATQATRGMRPRTPPRTRWRCSRTSPCTPRPRAGRVRQPQRGTERP